MPLKQEDTLRDVLIVAIGTVSINIVRSAKETLRTRYQLEDHSCRVHYLLVDTDTIALGQDHPKYESTYQVRLADDKGRANGHEYKEKIVAPWLEKLQAQGVIPAYVTQDLLDGQLLNRMETGESNKDPLKGYLYLLANLRRFHKELTFIKSKMVAPDRSIYVLYSPISGTAAGSWFLITSLLFQEFETSSPVLINLMPSHLGGDVEHGNRNYAIFGWSARLLDVMVRNGITRQWIIPQLTNPPIEVAVHRREPLYTLLQSAYRNQGADPLKFDEFSQVMAELLCLAVIGKQNAQGPPSADSQITNTETDQRMDELKQPVKPTRRFASRGYCAIRYNAKLAKEVTRLGVKDVILRYLLPDLPLHKQPAQVDQEPVIQPVSQKTLDEVKEHLLAYARRQVRIFYGEWESRGYRKAHGESLPLSDIDTTVDELRGAFSQDLTDFIKNLRGDGTDEAPIRQQFWEIIQKLLDHYGFGLLHHLSNILNSVQVDDAFIIQQLPELAKKHPTVEKAIVGAQQKIKQHRTRVSIDQKRISTGRGQTKPADLERSLKRIFGLLLEQEYTKSYLEALSGEFSSLLNGTMRYFAVELQRLTQRLENIYDENAEEYKAHMNKLNLPIGSYLDERTYALASEKIEKYRRDVTLIIRELFEGIDHNLDRHHLGQEQLSNRINAIIMNQEGIDEFPKDVAGVLRSVASNQNLLTLLLSKGRALTKLKSIGYEKNWCIWHSGTLTPALREALSSLQESINNVLSDEAFKVIVNDGPLPLRSKDDIELVLAETILDFPLADVETDKSMEYYWQQDEALFNNGDATSVHRVHTEIVPSALIRREQTNGGVSTWTQQEHIETDEYDRLKDLPRVDENLLANLVNQNSDELSEEDLLVAANRLGIDPEEMKSGWEAFKKR